MAYLASHEPCQLGEEISGNQLFQRLAKQLQLPRLKNEKVDQKDQYCSIRSDFGSVVKSPCVNWTERRAAVLICLFEGEEGELRVILTKRSMKLSSYPGDVALPGGKFEKGDADDSATALREAMEEIGLEPNLVRVAATLEPFISQVRKGPRKETAGRGVVSCFVFHLCSHQTQVPYQPFLLKR
ncbi:nudix hydrolase 3-like [Juglans regia]|uniref:Nudix hydrolase 3-like n=1 Tax=Juglans regia TaxID=51240 RepID=A0A6P9EB83_JUGRE|nr:nudix hydrolase 3-like [Juglans regia]